MEEEEEAAFWRGELGTEDILALFESGVGSYWILGRMVEIVNEEQRLSISDDDVDGEEEPGDGKGRTEGCYIDNRVLHVIPCHNLARPHGL